LLRPALVTEPSPAISEPIF